MYTLGLKDPAFLARAVSAGGPTVLPTAFPGLVRWYKASDYDGAGYSDGDPITTDWLDNSPSLEDATPQLGDEPLFKNTILSGGQSSVKMVNGFKHFDHALLTLGDYSIIAFWRPNADAIVASHTPGNYQVRDTTGGALVDSPSLFHNDGITLNASGANSNQIFNVRTWTRNGTTGVPLFYYNKSQEVELTGETSTASMLISTVGLFNGGPGDFDIVEFIVYNTILAQADVDSLFDNYFSLQYPNDI